MPQTRQWIRRWRRWLTAHIPLPKRRTTRYLMVRCRSNLWASRHRYTARWRWIRILAVALVVLRRTARATVHFHVFPEWGRMRVWFITARHTTVVWFVWGVDVRVFFSIRRIRKATITAFVFAFEWFLAWNNSKKQSSKCRLQSETLHICEKKSAIKTKTYGESVYKST